MVSNFDDTLIFNAQVLFHFMYHYVFCLIFFNFHMAYLAQNNEF